MKETWYNDKNASIYTDMGFLPMGWSWCAGLYTGSDTSYPLLYVNVEYPPPATKALPRATPNSVSKRGAVPGKRLNIRWFSPCDQL